MVWYFDDEFATILDRIVAWADVLDGRRLAALRRTGYVEPDADSRYPPQTFGDIDDTNAWPSDRLVA